MASTAKTTDKRRRKPIWLDEADAAQLDTIKREIGARSRPEAMRALFRMVPLPKKKAGKK